MNYDEKHKLIDKRLNDIKVFFKESRLQEGISLCKKSIHEFPDCALFYNNLSGFYYKKGELKTAGIFSEKALKINPGLIVARDINKRIKIKVEKKENEKILRIEISIIIVLLVISFILISLYYSNQNLLSANDLFQTGDYQKANKYYRDSLFLNPYNSMTYYNYAVSLFKIGSVTESREQLKKAIHLKPGYFDAYVLMADTFAYENNYFSAIKYYKYALNIIPEDAVIHNNIGFMYFKSGDIDRAVEEYKLSIKYKPGYFQAYYNMGFAYMQKREYENAIWSFESALKIDPENEAVKEFLEVCNKNKILKDFEEYVY
jgi:tetratricopeptide (TPR) repeat protein